MKNKRLILVSSLLIIFGFVIAIVTLSLNQFKFDFLEDDLISKTYEINDDFNSIECDLNVATLNIYQVEGENKAVCLEKEEITFTVEVVNNVLKVKEIDNTKIHIVTGLGGQIDVSLFLNKKTIDELKINTDTGDIIILDQFIFKNVNINGDTCDIEFMAQVESNMNITVDTGDVWINKVNFDELNIKTSTGDIEINDCIISNVRLESSTGDIELEYCTISNDLNIYTDTGEIDIQDSTCNNYTSELSTGKTEFENVVVNNDLNIKSTTGDIELKFSDALNLYITTSTGDVYATLRTNKIFNVQSNTGNLKYPETYTGGICKIRTDTGDVKIEYN